MIRISDSVNHVVTAFCAVITLVMLTISSLSIVLELLLTLSGDLGFSGLVENRIFDWAYSLTRPSFTRLFLPWLAMLSVTVAFKRGEHIAMTMLTSRLPPRALRAVQIVNLLVVAMFGGALVWYGYGFFVNSTQVFMVSDQLQVSAKWTAIAVPITGLVMCVHLLSGVALVEHHDPVLAELDTLEDPK